MKKDSTRDYVTEIFRKYAAAGYPTYEQEAEKIAKTASANITSPEKAIMIGERALTQKASYLADILAAEKTFEILSKGNKYIAVKAVKAVYGVQPLMPLHRGDITNRVKRFALLCPADTATVYRWLKEARLLCAALRGLTVDDDDINNLCE